MRIEILKDSFETGLSILKGLEGFQVYLVVDTGDTPYNAGYSFVARIDGVDFADELVHVTQVIDGEPQEDQRLQYKYAQIQRVTVL